MDYYIDGFALTGWLMGGFVVIAVIFGVIAMRSKKRQGGWRQQHPYDIQEQQDLGNGQQDGFVHTLQAMGTQQPTMQPQVAFVHCSYCGSKNSCTSLKCIDCGASLPASNPNEDL
ncbi:MAG: hypothetical protein FWD76_03990 [Firmicutes bacterium]|nr:hypothetical protein [Bacillota bacterium]